MVKYLFVGIWACIVSLGAAYGMMYWKAQKQHAEAHPHEVKVQLEQVKTKMISVPLVMNGQVHGYVLAQFTFTIEAPVLASMEIKPDLYLVDEAFRLIYSGSAIDFRTMRKSDVGALGRLIKEAVNKRFGKELVKEVFVQELNYLPKEQFRGGTGPKM